MLSYIVLSDTGEAKFKKWCDNVVLDIVNRNVLQGEICDKMFDRVASGESLVVELSSQFTTTGKPEHFRLNEDEIVMVKIKGE